MENKNCLFIAIIISLIIVAVGAFVYFGIIKDDSEESGVDDAEVVEQGDTDTQNEFPEPIDPPELGYKNLQAEVAYEMIMGGDITVIDVSPNYDQGHLPGAVNYYGENSLENAIPNLDPEGKYLVYCHSDSASRAGAEKLVDAGFKNVYRLKGNYSGWVDAGLPTE